METSIPFDIDMNTEALITPWFEAAKDGFQAKVMTRIDELEAAKGLWTGVVALRAIRRATTE
jgi:hypothetical protein